MKRTLRAMPIRDTIARALAHGVTFLNMKQSDTLYCFIYLDYSVYPRYKEHPVRPSQTLQLSRHYDGCGKNCFTGVWRKVTVI